MIRSISGGGINMIGPRSQRCVLDLAVELGDLDYAIHLFSTGARMNEHSQHKHLNTFPICFEAIQIRHGLHKIYWYDVEIRNRQRAAHIQRI